MIGTVQPNFFDRLAYAFGRASKALPAPAELYRSSAQPSVFPISFPGWSEYEKDHGRDTRDLANAKTAVNSTAVFADVQAIANEFSAAELVVQTRAADGTMEDIENHPLEDLWLAPNPHMGRSYLMAFWAWSYVLMGKAYLYWVPAGGAIKEVWPVPSFMLSPAKDEKQFVKGYWFKPRQEADATLIPAAYITASRSVNPFDPMDGMSFLAAALTSIKGDIAAGNWNTNFFADHNGIPDGLITVPKDTLDADLTRIREEIRAFFGGTRRGVAVARAGDLDYKPFGRSQKDAEFLEGRKFAAQEIGRALGFPDGYWSETANRANAEQARATMIAGAVWPLLVRLAEDLNAQTMARWWTADERVSFKDIRPEDRSLKLKELEFYARVLPLGRLLDKMGEKPIGDVRDLMLLVEIEKGTPLPATPASQETEDTIAAMEDEAAAAAPPEPDDGMDAGAVAEPVEGGTVEPLPEQKAADLRLWETKAINTLRKKGRASCVFRSAAIPDEDRAALSAALAECRTPQEVRAVFRPFSIKKADPDLKAALAAILARAQQDAADAIARGETPDTDALNTQLASALRAALVSEVLSGVTVQGAALGVAPDASASAPAWASTYVPQLIKDLNETTRDDLKRVIADYRNTPGMTRQDVIDALAGTFGDGRADMIAQTETTRAASQAAQAVNEYLRGQGLEYEYVWHTNNDERTCDQCGPLDGQVVRADELPPKHPRCRCSVGQTLKR